MPEDIIAIILIVLIIGAATFYIIRAKKNGQKCIGCPHSKTCKSNTKNTNCCSCNSEEKQCNSCNNQNKE